MHRWLRDVANVRVHATTAAAPSERLESEQASLQPVPRPYTGLSKRQLEPLASRRPMLGLQHPLALYDALAGVVCYLRREGSQPSPWIAGLLRRRPPKVVAVALANKMARIAWSVMTRGGEY